MLGTKTRARTALLSALCLLACSSDPPAFSNGTTSDADADAGGALRGGTTGTSPQSQQVATPSASAHASGGPEAQEARDPGGATGATGADTMSSLPPAHSPATAPVDEANPDANSGATPNTVSPDGTHHDGDSCTHTGECRSGVCANGVCCSDGCGAVCQAGDERACSEGGAEGTCAQGTQVCDDGSWGPCDVEAAAADSCQPNNDDDCNGIANEGCTCVTGDTRACSEGALLGRCADGTQLCEDGTWGACSIAPAASDTCEPGNDDNCNGNQNEGCPCNQGDTRPCSDGGLFGPCATGTQTCGSDGSWGACSVEAASFDRCNEGDDANCNGIANDPLEPSCDCVEGSERCVPGTLSTQRQTCTRDGSWGSTEDCEFVCTGTGVCTGVCEPGARECSGNTPRECGDDGRWENEPPCGTTTPCQGTGVCRTCDDGTFATAGVCATWTACQPGQVVSNPGSSTNDRQCSACPAGQFSTTHNATSCMEWSNCAPGQHVTNAGSSTSDRQCSACPEGQFSTTQNATSCTPWTTCPAGQSEATPGTATTDRTCGIASCIGLTDTCGVSSNESCCTSQLVTGSTYDRVNDPNYPAKVSNFRLDKFEVTVGRFRKFKAAWDGGWRPAAGSGKHTYLNSGSGLSNGDGATSFESGWNTSWASEVVVSDDSLTCDSGFETWTTIAGGNERRPINCVNWYEAYAFCIWDGGFLPSEAEWNFAAAGGTEQRQYPWSSPPSSTNINYTIASYVVDFTQLCRGDGVDGCTRDDLVFVGSKSKGNGRYSQAELGGNVAEWTLDWYAAASTAFAAPCDNCAFLPATASNRVVRGGSFVTDSTSLLNSSRYFGSPKTPYYDIGMRCARAP